MKIGSYPRKKRARQLPKKPCAYCGSDIAEERMRRGVRVTPYSIERSTYCSQECGIEARQEEIDRAGRFCEVCGSPIPRPEGMPLHRWRALKCCGPECRAVRIAERNRREAMKAAGLIEPEPVEETVIDRWLLRAPAVGFPLYATCRR